MFESHPLPDEPVVPPKFESLDGALEAVRACGVDEALPRLIRFFGIQGNDADISPFFGSLDFSSRIRLFECLFETVFESSDFSSDKTVTAFRKRIAGDLKMRKGDAGSFQHAVSSALAHNSDSPILYLRANPHTIGRFIGQVSRQDPEEANQILSSILIQLFGHISKTSSELG